MMRLASLALAIAGAALVIGLLAHPADRAVADYNITGEWTFAYESGTCTGTFSETKPTPFYDEYDVTLTLSCPDSPVYVLVGTLDTVNGGLGLVVQGGFYAGLRGVVSNGGHRIDGETYSVFPAPQSFHFVATGGDGAPKLGTDTPLPSATATPTPQSVAGVSFDVITPRNDSNGLRWLIALASVSIAALCGAELYARRRATR